MANDVAALQVRLGANVAEFQKGMGQAQRSMDRMSKNTKTLTKRFSSMQRNISGAAKAAIAFAGVSFGTSFLKGVISTNDAIAKTADQLGLGVEALQEFQFAAERSGVSTGQLNSNMQAFAKRMGELRNETGPLNAALSKYDQGLASSLKKAGSQEEALGLLSEAFKSAGDSTEQAYLANAAFGRSGISMINMLRDGEAGLQAFSKEARELGVIMDKDLVRASEEYQDRLFDLNRQIQVTFGAAFLKTVKSVMDNSRIVMFSFFGAVEKGWEGFKYTAQTNLLQLQGVFKTVIEGMLFPIKTLLEWMGKYSDYAKAMADSIPEFGTSAKQLTKDLDDLGVTYKANVDAIDDNTTALVSWELQTIKAKEAAAALRRERQKETNTYTLPANKPTSDISDKGAAKAAAEETKKATEDTRGYFQKLNDETQSVFSSIEDRGAGWIQSFSSNLAHGLAQGTVHFKDFAASIVQEIASLMLNKAIVSFLASFGGGAAGGAAGGGTTVAAAKGMALNNGVQFFAGGGVVHSPTAFPMRHGTGIMGEAGSEAILPLHRSGQTGNLGVEASVNVNVRNYGSDNVSVEKSGNDIDIVIGRIASDIAKGGNKVAKAIEGAYGVSRARGAY